MRDVTPRQIVAELDRHIADARERGADVLVGGGRASGFPTDLYYEFTILDRVTEESEVSQEESFGPVLPIIRHHKEHFDGTGYPDGLRGSEIPLKAQIVGIVDVYSALTNDRPFRRAKAHNEAIDILRDRSHPRVVC